jgi:antitoxin (DNA-binding transcriptional repressor) of toxin-antitoxin stability system
MATVAIEETPALAALAALVERVERGGSVEITRGGRPVATVARAAAPPLDPEEVVATSRRLRKGRLLGDLDIKALIEEGRE